MGKDSITLLDLDHDVLFQILSYLTAADLECGLSLVSKSMHQEARSPRIWKHLCQVTGKLGGALPLPPPTNLPAGALSTDSLHDGNGEPWYYSHYHSIPCVPVDYSTITQALEISSPGGTVTLMPGVYHERVVIRTSVRIRAADPRRGAAIVWYYQHGHHKYYGSQESGSNHMNLSAVEIEDSCTYVSLQYLTILHSSPGRDIWNGNCAVFCHGNLTHTSIDSCSIQSCSGRGVVVSNGASLKLSRCTVHDCAATGAYVGGLDSNLEVRRCNILRNGFGWSRSHQIGNEEDEEDLDLAQLSTIPPGHSGLYVETADAEIRSTLLADNCLTGVTVVQQGTVHVCKSDVVGNGQDLILVVGDEASEREQGTNVAVYEHSNRYGTDASPDGSSSLNRCPQVLHTFLTRTRLVQLYNKE